MKKLICGIILGLFSSIFCAGVFAYTSSEIMDASTYEALKKSGTLRKVYYKQGKVVPSLVPNTEYSKKTVTSWPADKEDPAFVVEILYYMRKDQFAHPDRVNIDYASKVMRSVSKMQGRQYYSSSDKKVMTLYDEVYTIKGPKDRTRVPDDTEGSADGKILYCMQKDHSFGKTNYRLEYHQKQDELLATFVNTTPLYVGPVKAINDENLRINMVFLDCGEDVVVYMFVQGKFPALSMLEDMMNDSFNSRMDAIYEWFIAQF